MSRKKTWISTASKTVLAIMLSATMCWPITGYALTPAAANSSNNAASSTANAETTSTKAQSNTATSNTEKADMSTAAEATSNANATKNTEVTSTQTATATASNTTTATNTGETAASTTDNSSATLAAVETSDEQDDANLAATNALPAGTYIFATAKSNTQVLDISGGSKSNGANAQLYRCNSSNAQRFTISYDSKGYATIKNVNSGKVLDVTGARASNGTNVQQYSSNGSKAQKWIITANSDGTYTIESALKSGLVLDVNGGSTANGANVQIYKSNGTKAQKWTAINTTVNVPSERTVSNGIYTIRTSLKSTEVIDIPGATRNIGVQAQLYKSNGTFAQKFVITWSEKEGYYFIKNLASGRYLDAEDGMLTPGARVRQYNRYAANQRWAIQENADGTYTLINAANGQALDLAGGKAANGIQLQTYTVNGTSSQKWTLKAQSKIVSDGIYTICSNLSSKRSLDISAGSTKSKANVQIYSSNNTPAQKFRIKNTDEANVITIEVLCSGMYLTQSGSNVVQATSNGSDYQKWKVTVHPSGGVQLANVATGKVLDVAGAVDSDGTNVDAYDANHTLAQSFILTSTSAISNGYYIVQDINSKRVVDVKSGSKKNGAKVQAWTANGTNSQIWKFVKGKDGYFTITNCTSGKLLDVKDANPNANAKVQQWEGNGNDAQKWTVEYTGNGGYRIVSKLGGYVLQFASNGSYNGATLQVGEQGASKSQSFRLTPATPTPTNYQNLLCTYSTLSRNNANGTYNMQKALNSFNGVIVQPGQTISFFDIAGPCGQAEGYRIAGVIGGEGYGGGICQAATTLYGALLRAGLTVVQRQNHSKISEYVPIGQDAMVSYGTSDLVMRNDWSFPIKIVTYTPNNELHVHVYGIQQNWYDDIEVDSWATSSNSAEAVRKWYKNSKLVRQDSLPSSYYADE